MFWRSKAMISLSSISVPTKRQWLEDSSLRKFLCLGILINQRKPFGLLPTTARLTNPSPHSSTTLADLFVLPFCADPLSAVRALMRRQSNDEIDDGSAHGWQAGLRWWSGDSFFPASLW